MKNKNDKKVLIIRMSLASSLGEISFSKSRWIETLKDKFKINSELRENCGIVYTILQRYQMAKRERERAEQRQQQGLELLVHVCFSFDYLYF